MPWASTQKIVIVTTKHYQEQWYEGRRLGHEFLRWVESAIPILLRFHEQGIILTVERVRTSGSNDRDSRIQPLQQTPYSTTNRAMIGHTRPST
jgi:hypothetical protein